MKIAYLTTKTTLLRVDNFSAHISFSDMFTEPGYISDFKDAELRGEPVIQVGGDRNSGIVFPTIVSPVTKYISDSIESRKWVCVVNTLSDYLRASEDPRVAVIGVGPMDAYSRISFFEDIIHSCIFSTKEHWLYGLQNPAELVAYSRLFAVFNSRKITTVLCDSCIVYSIYGVKFSETVGVLEPLPIGNMPVKDWYYYYCSAEQLRLFRKNQEIISKFTEGMGGEEFMENRKK